MFRKAVTESLIILPSGLPVIHFWTDYQRSVKTIAKLIASTGNIRTTANQQRPINFIALLLNNISSQSHIVLNARVRSASSQGTGRLPIIWRLPQQATLHLLLTCVLSVSQPLNFQIRLLLVPVAWEKHKLAKIFLLRSSQRFLIGTPSAAPLHWVNHHWILN